MHALSQVDLRFIHTPAQRSDECFQEVGDMFMFVCQQPVDRRHEILKLLLGDILPRLCAE